MKSWLKDHWPDLALILSLLAISFYVTFPVWRTDFIGGTDYLGHIYKGRFLADMWRKYGIIYPLWDSTWYAGYSFLQLYSPLSYLPLALGSFFLHNDLLSGKLLIVISYMFSGITMYLGVKKLFNDRLAAFISALAFLIYPFRGAQAAYAGNIPFTVSIALTPLFLAYYIETTKRLNFQNVCKAGILASLILLTHLNTFYLFVIVAALYSLWRFVNIETGENRFIIGFDLARQALEVGVVTFILSAWWLLPFIAQSGEVLQQGYSQQYAASTSITFFTSFWIPNQIDIYFGPLIGLSLTVVPILALIFTKIRHNRLAMFFLALSIILLPLSLSQAERVLAYLPLGSLVVPVRMLYVACVSIPIVFGVSVSALVKRQRMVSNEILNTIGAFALAALCLAAAYPLVVTTRLQFDSTYSIPKDYAKYLSFAKDQKLAGRILEVDAPQNTYVYAPALTGQETIDGWYREAAVIRDPLQKIKSALISPPDANDLPPLLALLDNRYVLGPTNSPELNKLLKTKAFTLCWHDNKYSLYKLKNAPGPIQEKSPILLVSKPPADMYSIEAELLPESTFVFVPGKYDQLDRYLDDKALAGYPTIFLYGYSYLNYDIEHSAFKKYIENGGTLIVAPDGSPDATPNDTKTVLGVDIVATSDLGKLDWRVTETGKNNKELAEIDFSKFASAEWEGNRWSYSEFKNCEAIVTANNKIIVGQKNIGRGKLIMVGFNLPYHIAYTQNLEETKMLKSIIDESLPATGTVKKSSFKKKPYGSITARITTKSKKLTWVLISESYMSGWNITVNYEPARVYKAYPGLILVRLEGDTDYLIEAKYEPTAWHYFGTFVSAAGLLVFFIYFLRYRFERKTSIEPDA